MSESTAGETSSTTTDKSPRETFDEAKELVVAYARQETIEPIKNLGKWLGFGIAGSIFVTLGTFTGSLTWVPYAVVLGGTLIVIGAAIAAIVRRPDENGSRS